MTLVLEDDLLRKRYELLVSIPGIAQVSAMQLLAELSTLPSDLTVREWVAHSGLDPAHEISRSSVRKASRISRTGNRHLRRAYICRPWLHPLAIPTQRPFRKTPGSKQSPSTGTPCCCEEAAPRHLWDISKQVEV
ncbi:MAG: IS110 family transposase [Acidobacteria bacterium]|nr:IS110 family transposase [Acidobacteriota bacterium]